MARTAGALLAAALLLSVLDRGACARTSTLADGPSVVTARLLTASVPGAAAQPILIPIGSGDAQPSPKVRAALHRVPPVLLLCRSSRLSRTQSICSLPPQVDYYGNSISWWFTQRCGAVGGCAQLRALLHTTARHVTRLPHAAPSATTRGLATPTLRPRRAGVAHPLTRPRCPPPLLRLSSLRPSRSSR